MVLGRGRLGSSIANALGAPLGSAREWRSDLPFAARALVMLAVPDQHVGELAAAVAGELREGQALVHLSGALPLTVLEPAPRRGAFHPLQSFPTPKPRGHFEGITVAIDGSDRELVAELEGMARELGATPVRVADPQRTLYHAAAVTAGPSLVALVGAAAEILQATGWTRDQAVAALLPLLRGTLANLEADGLPGALIGPVRRGDSATVERQLAAVRTAAPRAAAVYAATGREAVALARETGLDGRVADRLDALFAEASTGAGAGA